MIGKQTLHPYQYPECPLGFKCNDSEGLWTGNERNLGRFLKTLNYNEFLSWRNSCCNALYCEAVVTAWDLPLIKLLDSKLKTRYWEVIFGRIPHNFSLRSYYRYMKKYGYAEALGLPTIRDETLGAIRVETNYFNYGYAVSVSLPTSREFYYLCRCKIDKHGLWWITWGNPPKHSDERWEKLAKKKWK